MSFRAGVRKWLYHEDSWAMIIALGFAVSTTVLYFLGVDLLVWVNDISIRKWTTFNELLILLESHVGYYFLLLFVLLGGMSAAFKGFGLHVPSFVKGFSLLLMIALVSS